MLPPAEEASRDPPGIGTGGPPAGGAHEGTGRFRFDTPAGEVTVALAEGVQGRRVATLTSVRPQVEAASDDLVDSTLAACGWDRSRLDPRFPPAVAFAGARHLLLVLGARTDLAALHYDVERLRALMTAADLTTVALLWADPDGRWHARNAFPVGGVVEDPATGAAAAALGAYLRERGTVAPPADLEVVQGVDMGRPSRLLVHVPAGAAGIEVSGTAVPIG